MGDGDLRCAYHPNVNASGKCQKCGKLVCLECKVEKYTYNLKHEWCKKCDIENDIKTFVNKSSKSCIVMIVIIYLVLVPFTIIPITVGGIIALFSLIPAGFLGIFTFLAYRHQYRFIPTKRKQLELKMKQFLDGIKEDLLLILCKECGSRIETSTGICPKCGANLSDTS
ncbi:MAG: hypothetical protein ACFFDH_21635 [Promethearchaeota archaeon]